MLNLAAAVERAGDFDIIHYEAAYYPMSLAFARLSPTPIVQTLHHSPSEAEIRLWSRYPEAPFVAISNEQAHLLQGLNVVGTVLHGIDTVALRRSASPDDYLLFLGRFTEGKGVLQAIEVARRAGMRLILAAAENDYYRETVAPHVDGTQVVYAGEADFAAKVKLFGGARALLYPVQSARAVRSGAGRSDGLRHTGGGARSRRGARGRRRWRDRHRLRERGADGHRGAAARARPRSPPRPRARGRAVRRRSDGHAVRSCLSAAGVRCSVRSGSSHTPRSTGKPCRTVICPGERFSRSSPIPMMSRWRAAARWRDSPTPAPAWCCSALHAAEREP